MLGRPKPHPHSQGHMTLDNMREIFNRDLENMREKGIVRK